VTALPADYFTQLDAVEERHWWHRGMRAISAALLGERLRTGGAVLDAGCGTGGFLAWLLHEGGFERACGIEPSEEALELARRRLPSAELRPATLAAVPFPEASFDLVVSNDVLQHVLEAELEESMRELRRVLRPGGALLVRTNGARRLRRERDDWRAFDRAGLVRLLEGGGVRARRATYANTLGSLLDTVRGRTPRAPTTTDHGIPAPGRSPLDGVALRTLLLEARYLARPGRSLPYGHTLLALAEPR
jgi:SAM-dependent methyltransferase